MLSIIFAIPPCGSFHHYSQQAFDISQQLRQALLFWLYFGSPNASATPILVLVLVPIMPINRGLGGAVPHGMGHISTNSRSFFKVK
jgi:hypothetical protein